MKGLGFCIGTAALGTLFAATPAAAHHSFNAEFDREQRVEFTGTVTNVQWTNPHVWFFIDVEGPDGEITNWGVEMGAPHLLHRRGWQRNTLQLGEEVQVQGSLARDGSNRLNASQVLITATGQAPLDPGSSEGITP